MIKKLVKTTFKRQKIYLPLKSEKIVEIPLDNL